MTKFEIKLQPDSQAFKEVVEQILQEEGVSACAKILFSIGVNLEDAHQLIFKQPLRQA